MKRFYFGLILTFFTIGLSAQTIQQLRDSAATFPPMPREAIDMLPFVQGLPTYASGMPFNDLEFTLYDTDYMDGEYSGSDVFMPVDPSLPIPGENKVKLIRTTLNVDFDSLYNAANADRIILGTYEITQPFFLRGQDGVDNDYAVIQHFDYTYGHIQLHGSASDYSLVYCEASEAQTEGWYLFYTANNNIDLIAFIFPCWDLEPGIAGLPYSYPNALCNGDSLLNLTNANQFKYAQPISPNVALPVAVGQYGSIGKEDIGGMTVDNDGNMYLFGLTDGNLDGKTAAENEIFAIKVSPDGTQLWASELAMIEGSFVKAGITDNDYLYLAGRTLGNLPGYSNAGQWDGIVLKLNLSDGQIVGTHQWGNPGTDGWGNITQDDNGHIFVSAQGSPAGPATNDSLYAVAKYSKSSLTPVWVRLDSPNDLSGGFIKSPEGWGGLTYVPGNAPGDGRLIAGGWYRPNFGAHSYVAVFEDLNANTPTRPYAEVIGSPGPQADWVWDNAVDSQGNIYILGSTTGNIGGPHLGEGDVYIVKYSPSLTSPVYKQFGTNKGDLGRKLFIKNDTLYVMGYTYGNFAGSNADPTLLTGDIFIQKLDANLNLLDAIQFGTPHEDRGYGYLKDSILYIGGITEGSMAGNNLGSFDGFLVAVNTSDLSFVQPTTLSIDDSYLGSQVKLYPNPTEDRIYLDLGEFQNELISINIFNGTGQNIKSISTMNNEIELSGLPNGLYFFELNIGDKKLIKKVIKE